MARDINKRLSQLSSRRRGLDRVSELTMDSLAEVLAKRDITESYEQRSSKPYTKYALGAMQEVGPDYTRIGIEEATRVGKQLENGLRAHDIGVQFALQGSVPLNIHIRGVSDVDLLTLDNGFFTYDQGGASQHLYTNPVSYTPQDKLRDLRLKSEVVLTNAYPAANVDKSGSKAIKISGGSLRRAIDVVPSHWHNTTDYQTTGQQHDRGVKVYNKSDHSTFMNMPFRHIKIITDKDLATQYGLKKTIRLCKNVKADAEADGKKVAISSYEIASLMWHCNNANLAHSSYFELSLLAVTQQHLDYLARNAAFAMSLMTPDRTRKIIDNNDKMNGLVSLSVEIDDLAEEVAKEQATLLTQPRTLDEARERLKSSYIPLAG